ncbi:TerD family protein [Streptomyces wuyuanensis]|uniref:TerD family protein n=1 Tax=Streptomyces wuyuanensis TaxID=1196353 RepID=UPI0036AE257E
MTVNLSKGDDFSVTRSEPGTASVVVGLGWTVHSGPGDVDLDASALVLGADGRVLSDRHFVFFNNRATPEKSVRHTGDNKTGLGEGDDEQIAVDFDQLPGQAESVVFVVSIHTDGHSDAVTFGRVRDAYIRVVHHATGLEMCRFELTEDAHDQTAMVFGQLRRHDGEWKFRAIGQGHATGLAGIAKEYGVQV